MFSGFRDLWVCEVRLDDGETAEREVLAGKGNGAAVLPYDPERRVALLVRMLRPPVLFRGDVEAHLLEAPAGMTDGEETAEDTARREAMEEAGVRLTTLEPLAAAFTSPGSTVERLGLFLAPYSVADRVAPGGGAEGERENITVEEHPLADLARLADAGALPDMKTLLLLNTLRLRRPELFAEPSP